MDQEHAQVGSEEWLPGEEDEDEDGGSSSGSEEQDDDDAHVPARSRLLALLYGSGGSRSAAADATLRQLPRLPLPVAPLQSDFAAQLNTHTRALDVGQANPVWACLDTSFDALAAPLVTTDQQRALLKHAARVRRVSPAPGHQGSSGDKAGPSAAGGDGGSGVLTSLRHAASSVLTRGAKRRAAAADAPAGDGAGHSADGGGGASSSSGGSSQPSSGFRLVNTASLLLKREVSLGRNQGFSRAQQQHLACYRALPVFPQQVRDHLHSRAYIGQFAADGAFFVAAFQDRRVRLYDTARGWRLRKDVTTRMTRWTITDTTLSPDQRLLAYSSISSVVFVVSLGSSHDQVDSQANITELHEPLAFADQERRARQRRGYTDTDEDEDWHGGGDFGIWSIAWSPQASHGQLIAGTNNNSVYLYDVASKTCIARLSGHQDDVNAVAYLSDDPHVIVSGSDDSFVRVWDVRDRRGNVGAPQGVLVGHTEGITHICPKADGVHLISNSKDQTIKLWDVRAALPPAAAAAAARLRPRIPRWDYRWEDYPGAGLAVRHPGDVSLMTYRGHGVLQTLVRAYFSPTHTTGQRFIYAGSSDGTIHVWDVVSGQQVAKLQYHRALVRDCSWHPHEPELASVSWDGRVITWGPEPPGGGPKQQLIRGDRDNYAYY